MRGGLKIGKMSTEVTRSPCLPSQAIAAGFPIQRPVNMSVLQNISIIMYHNGESGCGLMICFDIVIFKHTFLNAS